MQMPGSDTEGSANEHNGLATRNERKILPLQFDRFAMGFTAALVGGVTGFSVQMFSNATRKVPLSRAPWLHVTYAIIGAWGANAYLRMEAGLVEDINAIRANKGMPPLVGSNAWIRYSSNEE